MALRHVLAAAIIALIATLLIAGASLAAARPIPSASAADRSASPETERVSGGLPVVVEHKYRMLAKARPLLFWISKDDVGGARIRWRGDDAGAFGLELLIGSDPKRAPRKINRWGYIAEQVRGSDARVIGVMKQSNEQSISEAESQLGREGSQGGYVYVAIRGTATGREAHAGVTTVRVERDLTFRDIDPLLTLVGAAAPIDRDRSVALPAGTRPGLLVALHDLVTQSADTYTRQPGASVKPSGTSIPYVYYGVFYDLTMTSSKLLKTAMIDGKAYTNVARSDFETRNHSTGEKTRFTLTYGTTGALAGIPVHAIYQPRWWLQVQLFLDDMTSF